MFCFFKKCKEMTCTSWCFHNMTIWIWMRSYMLSGQTKYSFHKNHNYRGWIKQWQVPGWASRRHLVRAGEHVHLHASSSLLKFPCLSVSASAALATMSSLESNPCPICFETVGHHWSTQKAWYHTVDNHSWTNEICDCHGICWSCLARHIEVQVVSEGKCSVR